VTGLDSRILGGKDPARIRFAGQAGEADSLELDYPARRLVRPTKAR
jgi:hypothetical protein